MKKRIVAMFLAAIMAMSVIACGSEPAGNKSTDAVQSSEKESVGQAASETPEDDSLYPLVEEPITIKGLVVDGDTSVSEDRIIWNKVGELTGVNVEWEVIDSEALATYLASGDWPDIIHYALSDSVVNDYGVIGGRFVNINDYLDIMPNLAQTYEDYPELKKASTESNGEIYVLGSINKAVTGVKVRPHIRMDVLDAAGLKKPETIDEFYNVLKTLKEKNGEAAWIPVLGADNSYWTPMVFSAFGTLTDMVFGDDGNGNVLFTRNTDQMKHYYEFMNKLYTEGLIHKESVTMTPEQRKELEKTSGHVAIIEQASGALTEQFFANGEIQLECCIPFTSEYDDTREIMEQSALQMTGVMYINAESDYVPEICQMLDIAYATEEVVEGSGLYGQSFVTGIEGVDWYYGEEGSNIYYQKTPEGEATSWTEYYKTKFAWLNFGRIDALKTHVTETPGNAQVRQISFVESVHPYATKLEFPTKNLVFTEDEQYVLDNKWTDIQKYYQEMEVKFMTGVEDIETGWDGYCKTLEQMGLSEVLEVYQAAYDRWNGK